MLPNIQAAEMTHRANAPIMNTHIPNDEHLFERIDLVRKCCHWQIRLFERCSVISKCESFRAKASRKKNFFFEWEKISCCSSNIVISNWIKKDRANNFRKNILTYSNVCPTPTEGRPVPSCYFHSSGGLQILKSSVV